MAKPQQHQVPTFGARISITYGVPDENHSASALDPCGLHAAAQHFNQTEKLQIKPTLIECEGQPGVWNADLGITALTNRPEADSGTGPRFAVSLSIKATGCLFGARNQ